MAKRTAEELAAAVAEHHAKDRFTYKTDIWKRVTEQEAEALDEALKAAPAKQRRMWEDSLSVEHSSDYYLLLKTQMVEAFGESRAGEILAPSS